ncbi:RNA polymerase sigma-70 factor [Phocaeicola dorei]|uniref:RNA polymerase sigma-70 factor n=1 Tax=Phocaeicola dorei TaxID=357276 RepID=UPI003F2569B8
MMVIDKERLLIHSLKLGSTIAFDRIYQMYAKRLYAYSLQFTKSAEDAEEIVQDVFTKLWINREGIKQEDSLKSLLFTIAKHLLINAFRSKVNQQIYEDYVEYANELSTNDTTNRIEYNEFLKAVEQNIATLPNTQQKVIKLSRFEHLSNKEIAERMQLSEQTVKNQLSVGLKLLKEKLRNFLVIGFLVLDKLINIFQ